MYVQSSGTTTTSGVEVTGGPPWKARATSSGVISLIAVKSGSHPTTTVSAASDQRRLTSRTTRWIPVAKSAFEV